MISAFRTAQMTRTMHSDVIIIGSGQAGVPLAVKLSKAGKRVVLIERGQLGGTCINTGCTPTKVMIASARAAHVARNAGRLGVRVGEVSVDLGAVVDRKDKLVGQWRSGTADRITSAGAGLRLVRGHARFVGERTVEVNQERLDADTIIINTGARHTVPSIEGLESVAWLNNRHALNLRQIPSHLLVIGGGYIGCELAQMFRRFGSRVTIVDRSAHLVSREDSDVSTAIESVFRSEGIELELEQSIEAIEELGEDVCVRLGGNRQLRGTHLLVATGRRPNTDDLACKAGGVDLDDRGFIVIDERYQSSASGVYAVGDVTGEPQFTHVAWDDHRILYDLLMNDSKRDRTGRAYPHVIFTDPQVAGVGLSETQARDRGIHFEMATYPYSSVARARQVDEPAGFLKVLIDPSTERILGASIVGAEAGEVLHVFVALMQAKASARAIVDAQFVHPTFAEGVQSVVLKLDTFAGG